jgi:hypothetical protein
MEDGYKKQQCQNTCQFTVGKSDVDGIRSRIKDSKMQEIDRRKEPPAQKFESNDDFRTIRSMSSKAFSSRTTSLGTSTEQL